MACKPSRIAHETCYGEYVNNSEEMNFSYFIAGCVGDGILGIYNDECLLGFNGLFDTSKNRFVWKKYFYFPYGFPEGAVSLKSGQAVTKEKMTEEKHEIIVRSLANGKKIKSLEKDLNQFLFSADGKYLIGVQSPYKIYFWETMKFTLVKEIELNRLSCKPDCGIGVLGIACHPDSIRIAIAAGEYKTFLIDLNTFEITDTLKTIHYATNVKFSRNGQFIMIIGAKNKGIYIYKMPNYELEAEIRTGKIGNSAISPNGRYVASIEKDKEEIDVWDVPSARKVAIIDLMGCYYSSLAFTKDGNYLTASASNKISFWDINGKFIRGYKLLTGNNIESYLVEQ